VVIRSINGDIRYPSDRRGSKLGKLRGITWVEKAMSIDKRQLDVFDVGEAEFHERVIEASQLTPILVDFWAQWCAPCLALAPALEKAVAAREEGLRLAKVEVDDNMRLAGRYRLRGFPTVILFHRGEEVGRFAGARPCHWIGEWLDRHLGAVLP